MTQPIGGDCHGYTIPFYECHEDPIYKAAQGVCKNADTVATGFLCDEPTVVSNACRSPTNKLDAFICDDKKMAEVQDTLWSTMKSLAFTVLGAILGKSP
jgi:hypothetical protein